MTTLKILKLPRLKGDREDKIDNSTIAIYVLVIFEDTHGVII